MHYLMFSLFSLLFANEVRANSLVLDFHHDKIMQSLGPLDQNYFIPPQVLAYIEGSENLDTDRGQALLRAR